MRICSNCHVHPDALTELRDGLLLTGQTLFRACGQNPRRGLDRLIDETLRTVECVACLLSRLGLRPALTQLQDELARQYVLGRIPAYIGGFDNIPPQIREDLAQDVAVRITRSWAGYPRETRMSMPKMKAIVRKTARHLLIDWFRSRRSDETMPAEEMLPTRGTDFVDFLLIAKLDAALRTLDQIDRKIIVERHVLGHSFRKIAEQLSMPEATVRSRYHRALARLREYLSD